MIRVKGIILITVVLIAFITCSSSSKEEATVDDGSWYVTVSGKVLRPSPGKIVISELTENGGNGWSDTIQLKSDNTFSKEIKVSEPGYYKVNFFNVQVLNVILYKSDIEINVDGSTMNGMMEINGSPDLDLIGKVTDLLQGVQQSPEAQQLSTQF